MIPDRDRFEDLPTVSHIADPTIADVFEEFLQAQQKRLSPRTFANYRNVIGLLQNSLDGYASQSLDRAEQRMFDRFFNAEGEKHKEFCELFGPDHILPNLPEFLNYFMVRKVICGKELLAAAGTVTKKLAKWLEECGYVGAEATEDVVERIAESARDLPQADELASRLQHFTSLQPVGRLTDEVEDRFTVTRIESGRIWLEGMLDGRELGPIRVPADISKRCKVGWGVSGVVGQTQKRWKLVETWNVYPE